MSSSVSKHKLPKNSRYPSWKPEESEPKNIISQEYIENRPKKPSSKRFAYEKLLQLKPLVDRIIDDCKAESSQVRIGLQTIKQYQLDVLDELEEGPAKAALPRAFKEGFEIDGNEPEILNLKEQNLNLMTDLNNQIRNGNKLAKQYKQLETEYDRLKKELARGNHQPSSEHTYQGRAEEELESWIGTRDRRSRPADILPIINYQATSSQNQQTQQYRRRKQEETVPENDNGANKKRPKEQYRYSNHSNKDQRYLARENAGLRQQIANLENKLTEANSEIDHLNRLLRDRQDSDNIEELKAQLHHSQKRAGQLQELLKANGDVLAELAKLKDQNQDLRLETIKLLKAKDNGTGRDNYLIELEEELSRLRQTMDRENDAKRQFLEDITEYKHKFSQLENTIKSLRSQNQQLRSGHVQQGVTTYGYSSGKYAEAAPFQSGPERYEVGNHYDDMASALYNQYSSENGYTNVVIGNSEDFDSKLSKYKNFLNHLKSNPIA